MWRKWVCVFCLPLCGQDSDRNFTGTWNLNTASSQIGALPVPPDPVLRIRHSGFSIECAPEELVERGCSYRTDGAEARLEGRGVTISSRAKWEGSSLLINSIVSGPKSYTRMDRWTLSRDGNTLRVRRQVVSRYGETESVLFYDRQSPTPRQQTAATTPGPEATVASPATRFGRDVLKPVDPAAHQSITLEGITVPSFRSPKVFLACLAYEDEARIYVELVLRNDSARTVDLGENLIVLEIDGRPMPRLDAARVSRQIEAGALRSNRASTDGQARRHLQWQEQESALSELLSALGQAGAISVGPGQEQTILATFEQRPDRNSPVVVKIHAGVDAPRFALKSAR